MKIEKDKRNVGIVCNDGSLVKGTIHINPGERILDFLNDTKEDFIAVTNAEFYHIKEVQSFTLFAQMRKKRSFIFLNKSSIKILEEL